MDSSTPDYPQPSPEERSDDNGRKMINPQNLFWLHGMAIKAFIKKVNRMGKRERI